MTVDLTSVPADIPQFDPIRPVTKLVHLVWTARPDLQSVFDISTAEGQAGLKDWAKEGLPREYGLELPANGDLYVGPGTQDRAGGGELLSRLKHFFGRTKVPTSTRGMPGVSLIGYAAGVLGMGEHVRMSAEALSATEVQFGLLDIAGAKRPQLADHFPIVEGPRFRANIFHVNADQMLPTYCQLGPSFFRDRYNIGFWAWELSGWPAAWRPVLDLVHEVWAPSRFIRDCLASATNKPVTYMPLCVELPRFDKLSRARFGLPAGVCLFLFTFDFHSYIARKNPFAAIKAFKKAFPVGQERAALVIKVMNADPQSPKWREMIALIGDDARIHVINEVMSRAEMLALTDLCDCFVSLHRSEGFGRGPAEAMYLGKPVIVTNYSGNTDFTRPGACLLVDYQLVPVGEGEYVHGEGQVWADPDVEHAAAHMRNVQEGLPEIAQFAAQGQAIIRNEFSNAAVGRKMSARLDELGLLEA